jgi:DNA-binding NarL/FixJ family response regulator
MTLRILHADDHAMFRSGLRAILSTQPDFECVGEVPTGTRLWPRSRG